MRVPKVLPYRMPRHAPILTGSMLTLTLRTVGPSSCARTARWPSNIARTDFCLTDTVLSIIIAIIIGPSIAAIARLTVSTTLHLQYSSSPLFNKSFFNFYLSYVCLKEILNIWQRCYLKKYRTKYFHKYLTKMLF